MMNTQLVEAARRLQAAIEDLQITAELTPDVCDSYPNARELILWLEVTVRTAPGKYAPATAIDAVDPAAHWERTHSNEFEIGLWLTAREIAGDAASNRLVGCLRGAAGWLVSRMMKSEKYPRGYNAFRHILETMAADARFLLALPPLDARVRIALGEVIERAEAAAERIPHQRGSAPYYPGVQPSHLGGSGATTSGENHSKAPRLSGAERRRARHGEEGQTPHEMCAAIIAEAWNKVRGEYPRPQRISMHRACEALWRTCGGTPSKVEFRNWSADAKPKDVRSNSKWLAHCQAAARHRADYGARIAMWFRDYSPAGEF